MTEQAPRKVSIDGVEYIYESLSDNAKGQLQGLQIAETEIKRLGVQTALMKTARNAYMQALQADLPKP